MGLDFAKGKEIEEGIVEVEGKRFVSQDKVNDVAAFERKKAAEKFSDYEDLKKRAVEWDKEKAERENKDLEAQKNYEKLKEGWQKKEEEYKGILSQKDQENRNIKIMYELNQEIMKQNAHPDAAKLVRELTAVDDKGNITIKGKNAQGVESDLSIADGIKGFLKDRPYLVKAGGQGGAGTAGAGGGAGASGASGTQPDLADQLMAARRAGDYKKVLELKNQIRQKHTLMPLNI